MYYNNDNVPFQKAILASGATTARAVLDAAHPRHELQFREFLIECGIEQVPEEAVIETLRTLPLSTIVTASNAIFARHNPNVTWPFQPVVDGPGGVIPDTPINMWRAGHFARIPLITGFATNEGTMFVPKAAEDDADFRRFMGAQIPLLSDDDWTELERLYPNPVVNSTSPYYPPQHPHPGVGEQWWRLDAAYAHFAYICPVLQTAHWMSTAPPPSSFPSSTIPTSSASQAAPRSRSPEPPYLRRRASYAPPPVYVYQFDALEDPYGTCSHASEGNLAVHDSAYFRGYPGLEAIAAALYGHWRWFVINPNGNPLPPPAKRPMSSPMLHDWPAWRSPLRPAPGDGGDNNNKWEPADGGDREGVGRLAIFGRGNDERRAGGSSRGTAAEVVAIEATHVEQCRFWWERTDLSEGLGRRPGKA